jgi:hypothetical protein
VRHAGADQTFQIDVDSVERAVRAHAARLQEIVKPLDHEPLGRQPVPPVPFSLRPDLECQPAGRFGRVGIGDRLERLSDMPDPANFLVDDRGQLRPRLLFVLRRQPRQGQFRQSPRERLALFRHRGRDAMLVRGDLA